MKKRKIRIIECMK